MGEKSTTCGTRIRLSYIRHQTKDKYRADPVQNTSKARHLAYTRCRKHRADSHKPTRIQLFILSSLFNPLPFILEHSP
jgi:hypothetical protein